MSRKRLRVIASTYAVPAPARGASTTRLRLTSEEASLVQEAGQLIGSHLAWATRQRSLLGTAFTGVDRARLKRELTARGLSSRQAGAVLGEAMRAWRAGRDAQHKHARSTGRAIAAIGQRAAMPVGEKGGYPTAFIRRQKLARAQQLTARLERLEHDQVNGTVHIVRGGRGRANTRHNLPAAGLSLEQWRQEWDAARAWLSFPGEGGKRHGNDVLRWDPDTGIVELQLPAALAHHAPRGRLRLEVPVAFARHGEALAERARAGLSIHYRIRHDTQRDRWYLDASWQQDAPALAPLSAKPRVLGVDRNEKHVDAQVLDQFGNPEGPPHRVPLNLTGLPSSTRDARVRACVTTLIHLAKRNACEAIAIEELGWGPDGADAREKYRPGFRVTLSQFPTHLFKARAAAMIARASLHLLAVDPAYTSKWGAQWWARPLRLDRHQSAAIVIGRRAQGYSAKRVSKPRSAPEDAAPDRNLTITLSAPITAKRAGPRMNVNQQATRPKTARTPSTVPPVRETQHRSASPDPTHAHMSFVRF